MFAKIFSLSLIISLLTIPAFAADSNKAKSSRKPVKISEPMNSSESENVQTVIDPSETESAPPAKRPRAQPKYDYSTEGRISRGQIGVELLGAGLLYSFIGSYLVTDQVALNGGISYFTLSSSSTGLTYKASVGVTQIPVSVSYLMGGPDHHFEILGGGDLIIASASVTGEGVADKATASGFLPEIGMGYRYWPSAGGFHFRGTLYGLFLSGNFAVWPGLSFGYAF